jgi:hypothetical protein
MILQSGRMILQSCRGTRGWKVRVSEGKRQQWPVGVRVCGCGTDIGACQEPAGRKMELRVERPACGIVWGGGGGPIESP